MSELSENVPSIQLLSVQVDTARLCEIAVPSAAGWGMQGYSMLFTTAS